MEISVGILATALGALAAIASAVFFIVGRRAGTASELARQKAAKASSEEIAKRIVGESEREAESLRKSAVVSGKEEIIRIREAWEQEARHRREEVEREERRVEERQGQLDKKFDLLDQRE